MIPMRAVAVAIALLCCQSARAQTVESEFVIQRSLAAGLRHHSAKGVWDAMGVGDALQLVREPTNSDDVNAVRIEWQGVLLGYLPKGENAAVARQLDRGAPLRARVAELAKYRNHRLKLALDIYLPL